MAMILKNNMAAQLTLGEVNKNVNALGKALAKVSSGQKINGAKDDSAMFAVSEVMRVRIRALEQDIQNVQNGSMLLKTAEEGIQQQIELLRTIKEKVIDAANDTNTDWDRKIIQKEIYQLYDQMEQTAYQTDYNTKKPLLGNKVVEQVIKQVPYLEEVKVHLQDGDPGISGEMNIIADKYMTLDGLTGPFDTFVDYDISTSQIKSLGFNPSKIISNQDYSATPYESAYVTTSTTKITNWDNAADPFMNNRGFYTQYNGTDTSIAKYSYYVLTDSPGTHTYQQSVTEIDISGCNTTADVMAKIDDTLEAVTDHSGSTIKVDKDYTFYGWQQWIPREDTTSSAGPFTSQQTFSGAVYDNTYTEPTDPIPNGHLTIPGHDGYWSTDYNATSAGTVYASFNLSNIGDDSGFTVYNQSNSPLGYCRFVDGPLYSDANTDTKVGYHYGDDGVVQVSKDYLSSSGSVSFSLAGGTVTITSSSIKISISPTGSSVTDNDHSVEKKMQSSGFTNADNINHYYVANGISAATGTNTVRVRALGFEKKSADATMDLSNYQTTDRTVLENFINDLAGKALKDDSYGSNSTNPYTNSTYGWHYEFIDSKSADLLKKQSKIYQYEAGVNYGNVQILDLDNVRNYVQNSGMTIADAFSKYFDDSTKYSETVNAATVVQHRITQVYNVEGDESSGVNSIQLLARNVADSDVTISAVEGELRHYDLDFNDWFDNHQDLVYYNLVSEYIDGKGFRAFCATDATEWFNFIYRDGKENFKDDSFDAGPHVHTMQIDVSGVKTAEELAQAIYEQAEPELKKINHALHLTKGDSGVVTIYDERALSNYFYKNYSLYADFQTGDGTDMNGNAVNSGGGAKIADGVVEEEGERDVYEKVLKYREVPIGKLFVKDLIIQDTDKASMNVKISIPQMTLSNIFYPLPNDQPPEYKDSIQNYTVLTKANRDLLLGDTSKYPPKQGILDKGLDYLLDAAVMVGAQRSRLDYSQSNLVTQNENTISSESVIRDADMAKEMTEYTKLNVLAQSSQAMLAQANQNLSGVLSLLQ